LKSSKRLFRISGLFEKGSLAPKAVESRPIISISETLIKAKPTAWVVFYGYLMALLFSFLVHRFFLWCPPYLQEIAKNLRGLPFSWFQMALYWMERGVIGIAFLSALYHNVWKWATTYKLTDHDIQIANWFPMRHLQSVPYGAVKRLGFKQSFLGVVLNYGHVEIDTGSAQGPILLVNCPQPKKFMETLQHKVEEVLQPQLLQNRS
jgi:uncharacterized membrane protein YdbT with pleckstrin-like domain